MAAASRPHDQDDMSGPLPSTPPAPVEGKPANGAASGQHPLSSEKHETTNGAPPEDHQAEDHGGWEAGWATDEDSADEGDDDDTHRLRQELDTLDADSDDMSSWTGQSAVMGGSDVVRMMLLTFNSIGISFTWSVEMTYCTPYLLSLGLTKGQTSMVWIAGPLSGLIVQPIIGVISDGSKLKWGRRRPFIVVGSVIVALSLLTLGFTKEIIGLFIADDGVAKLFTIGLAVMALYCTDFAINAVMSCSRSLLVDTLPITKQQSGAAWASRMGSLGHVIGYGMGGVNLVGLFGTALGDTQFKQLTIIAASGILLTSLVTCYAVTERVLLSKKPDPRRATGRFKIVRQIWSTLQTLPPRIQAICWIVFWSWIGWFPFLIYSSTWVGETYFRFDVPEESRDSKDALGDMGRVGSFALTVYSSVTFLSAWLLPLLVKSPEDDQFTHRPPQFIANLLEKFNKSKPTLLTAWFCAHIIFATAMFMAPFAASFRFATLLVGVCGIPWTIAMWAPATFLGVEVNKMGGSDADAAAHYRRLSVGSSIELPTRGRDAVTAEQGNDAPSSAAHSAGELSGIYFGILNIYTTLPQFIVTFISTIVFAILEPGKSPELATDAHPSEHHSTDGPNAIAVCLFIGAIAALGAAYATRRLMKL